MAAPAQTSSPFLLKSLFVYVVVLSWCIVLYPVYCQNQRLATFYGAYQRVKALPSDTGLNLHLNFKTSLPTGLILAVRLDQEGSNAGYLAAGLKDEKFLLLLSENDNSIRNSSVEILLNTWHELSVVKIDNTMSVELTSEMGESYSFSFSLSTLLTVKDVFLGGANSFFSPAFVTLEITEYFTGCLANGTFNNREIDFAPKLDGYGMEYGCCPNPEPIKWNFVHGNRNSFVFNSRLSHRRFQTDILTVSFLIQPEYDGMVFYTHDEDVEFALAIELVDGRLVVLLANEMNHFEPHSLTCEHVITDGWLHRVSVTVHEEVLECFVDGSKTSLNASRPMLPLTSMEFHVGSAELSTFETNLLLFQTNLQSLPSNGMFLSFTGSLQKFQLNGLDVSPSSDLSTSSPSLSPACPLPTLCEVLSEEVSLSQLSSISVDNTDIHLIENETILLTDEHLVLIVPEDIVGQSDVQEAIAMAIEVTVVTPPVHGKLINVSNPHQQIEEFTYSDIINQLIAYRHNGEEISSDSITFTFNSICSSSLSQIVTVDIVITLINDFPLVTRQDTLSIAVGTRRVINSDIITVEDEESLSLISISFRVLSISSDDCLSQCGMAGRIERTTSLGLNSTAFNQREINQGEVTFQHFVQYGISPITIHLRVSDTSGASIDIKLSVIPYVGHVTLTWNEPLYIVEGRCSLITSEHLHADTDFNDQDPILQYSVIDPPEHGRLEIQDQGYWRPVVGGPNIDFEGFTQDSVDRNFVRYCHDNRSLETDTFQFQLHSTLLQAGGDNFTINVYAYTDLPRATVSLATSPVHLSEGEEVVLMSSALEVSLERNVRLPWSQKRIQIQDFYIVFHVTTTPKVGEIFMDGEHLTNSRFTHAQLVEGRVTYRHDDSENHSDYISVRIEAVNSNDLPIQSPTLPPVTNLSFIVAPVNDQTPLIETSRITLNEGLFVTITPEVLSITDDDQPPQIITVTILDQNISHGYFADSSNHIADSANHVDEFTSEDINDESIYFHHQFNNHLSLTHTVSIRASDGERYSDKNIEIVAEPLIIDVSHVSDVICVDLDATEVNVSVLIPQSPFLGIEIRDNYGSDINRLQSMTIWVSEQPRHGQLLLGDNLDDGFMLNDIANGLVSYELSSEARKKRVSKDTIQFEIRYGHSVPQIMMVHICIDPVPVPDIVGGVVINSISVATDSSFLIDNRTFSALDTRGNGGEGIWYFITHRPQWGRVVDEHNNSLANFTQASIDNSHVLYQHDNRSSNTRRDYFLLRLCTMYDCSIEYNVTVTFSVDVLTIYNHGLKVDEGGESYITKERLDAISPHGGVRFHITKHPNKGKLILNAGFVYQNPIFFDIQDVASRSVYYRHDGSESLEDSFTFSVTTGSTSDGPHSDIFHITINPINNHLPTLTVRDFSVIARTTKNITEDDLGAFDRDSDVNSSSLRYELLVPPSQGIIHFRNESTQLTQWYERDIRAGLLAYTHTAQEKIQGGEIDVIGVNLYDNERGQVQLFYAHINEIQLRVVEMLLTVPEGGVGTINDRLLHAESEGDDSLTDYDLKFQLESYPRNGRLTLRGAQVTNFTQADLLTPGLVYEHDHSNTMFDSFIYTVRISQHNAKKTGVFQITIDPIDDDPPILTFLHKPLFVVEGSEIHIIKEHIDVYDFDTNMNLATQTNLIKFKIISQPQHGEVRRNLGAASEIFRATEEFTLYEVNHRAVKYISDPLDGNVDFKWWDSFVVNLTDGKNTQDTPYNFTFIILPNIVSVRVSSFTVAEGGSVVVPGNAIIAVHPYLETQLGCIIVKESPRNGTLVNLETGETNISNFTTNDLILGFIEYRHNDAENEIDHFTFTYEAHQPTMSLATNSNTQPGQFPDFFMRTSDKVTMEIHIDTVNDRGPEILSEPDTTLVMWAEDCAFLSIRHLNVFDADTPNNKLIYSFNFTFDAYISHVNDSNSIEISSFSQEDVVNSIIKLHHRYGDRGIMYYTVTDGEFTVSSQLYIETHRLEVVVLHNNLLTVPMNGEVTITTRDLEVGRSDRDSSITVCRFDNDVEFRFETSYGVIVVDGVTNATSFTDDDIKSGLVSYRHTKPELWEPLESLKLKAKATLTKFKEFHLNIKIDLPSEPNSPLAVHKSLSVEEGGRVCMNESVLDARNIRYEATKASYNETLTSWFYFNYVEDSHGVVEVNGRRPLTPPPVIVSQAQIANMSVCYRNLGDESTEDRLRFYIIVKDSGGYHWHSTGNLVLNISVTLINDEEPMVMSASLVMNVVEGFSALIWNDSLLIVDEDNPAEDLVFTILDAPQGGQLWLGTERLLLAGDKFTQAKVNEGALGFEALDVGTWTMLLSFTDGEFSNESNFTVFVEEHFIKVLGTEVLRYSQNEGGTNIASKDIITLTNGEPNDTIYTVLEHPLNGELVGLRGNGFFTQSDLISEKVSYIPTNFKAHSDSFKLVVGNREAQNETVTIEVKVEVWGDVKQNTELDFATTNEKSLPLPKNILQLPDLQLLIQRPPIIKIIQPPKLGYLEVKVSGSGLSKRSSSPPPNKFLYDYLNYDWVYYTWNASNISIDNPDFCINDSFSILVEGYEGIQPGEATISLCLKNPPFTPVSPSVPTEEPSITETTTAITPLQEDASSSGFPQYALLPILGVFLFLLVIIIVVIVFCVTQQGRIRKRWQPRLPGSHWAARNGGQSFPLQPNSNIYNMEPSSHTEGMTSLTGMVDHGADYPEAHSHMSRQSPLSRYSPMASHSPSAMFPPPSESGQSYRHHLMIPRPRSRRSNVSVSYSHRPLSEVTLEELPRSRHHTFSPPLANYVTPNVARLADQCSTGYEGGEGESGYLSTPAPSIAADDEPVRLVRRRLVVEEVSPLPRTVDEEEDEQAEEESHGNEEGNENDNQVRGEEVVREPASIKNSGNLEDSDDQPLQQRVDDCEENSQQDTNKREDTAVTNDDVDSHLSNEPHVIGSPPSDQEVPLLPKSSSPTAPASAASENSIELTTSPSDLHTVFRTHNPILKHTEYWV